MSGETLSQLFDELKEIKQSMATKEDISNMATKEDISNMATKEDIANMATKEDISNMATKDDLLNLATKEDVAEIPYIKRAVREISDKVDVMAKEMVLKEDFEYVQKKIAEHDRDIFKLKNRAF